MPLAGNPTVLLVLFVPDDEVVFRNEAGTELARNAHRFVSRLAAGRFLGYLKAQKAAMTGQAGAHTSRMVSDAEARLTALRDGSALPGQPDRGWVNGWLHRSYLSFWAA